MESPKPPTDGSHGKVERKQPVTSEHKGPSIFDYKVTGFPWPFVAIMSIIGLGLLGILLKTMGLF